MVIKGSTKPEPTINYLRFFLDQVGKNRPRYLSSKGPHRGKLCPPDILPYKPLETKELFHSVYSKRSNVTCLQLSVTIAGAVSFWEILKDLPSLDELTGQSITVKKIHF